MIIKSKLALALGVVSAIALAAPAAQARTKHHNEKSIVSGSQRVHRLHRSYNFVPAPLPGIGIGEPNGPTNYNRNQS